jgi:DNA-binding LacI/PurR family transcriptional regulator
VPYKVALDHESKPRRGYFPVIWEAPSVVEACLRARRPALLLNDRPQPGLSATYLDSVSIDDFSGGAGAAQLLMRSTGEEMRRLAVLAGPEADARSVARVGGFLSVIQSAEVIHAGSWYFEDGYRAAARVVEAGPAGVFCANDRLADAVRSWCADQGRQAPPLVGFDDAPVAEKIGLTTMAIPWDEFIAGAAELIKRRVGGDAGGARQLILTPRPVVRS